MMHWKSAERPLGIACKFCEWDWDFYGCTYFFSILKLFLFITYVVMCEYFLGVIRFTPFFLNPQEKLESSVNNVKLYKYLDHL